MFALSSIARKPFRTMYQATRCLHIVPRPRDNINSPADFLGAIGRSMATKLTVQKWEEFWAMSRDELKKAGVGVKDRRYTLWAMEKYRQGGSPTEYAIPEKPKKKYRGWGPRVQKGKRIR